MNITGTFGLHAIQVQVNTVPTAPFISGPTYVKPGDTYSFELQRHTRDDVYWEIEKNPTEVVGIPDLHDKKKYSVKVEPECKDCAVTLYVRLKTNRSLVAQKNINILEAGSKKQPPIIKIGKKEYRISSGVYFPETVAQVDYLFNESQVLEIVINPIHPRIKDMGYMQSMDHILAAIANVAMIDQVYDKLINPSEAQGIAENFVAVMKDSLLNKKQ